ncbi:uncharacterized protein LOC116266543 [Nymphaea colorata]|nr:uncharacterized protein LOC116266543 [Nymphaea colorata]XP_031503642.1 uncharacterized protein LOC116266543 [Nymphaea colorata]XP_031503645.1 uncharacterized protein LOC116266543 [Nymphaea colorata]XP_031503647.1 uncharacterized protein LOC116266543 [Nymphaea colorata]
MCNTSVASRKYVYINNGTISQSPVVDAHHIIFQKTSMSYFMLWLLATAFIVTFYCMLFYKEHLGLSCFWSILLYLILTAVFHGKVVKKESILIMPMLGVQLETHYRSGRIHHRFVPIDKILKPVLNECVTPVTCYWSLALILQEDAELTLVFQEVHPPLEMLVLVWKALCAVVDGRLAQMK